MRAENALGDTARFEQHIAKQYRIANGAPYRPDGISACGDPLDKHRVNCHAHQNEHPLESHGEQRAQIVLARVSQFPVGKGRHRDGGQAGEQIYFNHAAIDQHENNDIQRPHGNADNGGLEPQAQKRP